MESNEHGLCWLGVFFLSPFFLFSLCRARFRDDDRTVSASESDVVELAPLFLMINYQIVNPIAARIRIGIEEPSLLSAVEGPAGLATPE